MPNQTPMPPAQTHQTLPPTDARREPARTPADPTSGTQGPAGNRLGQWSWWLGFLALLLVNYLVINTFQPGQTPRVEVSYTFFKQQVEAGNVPEISSRGDTIQGAFASEVRYPPEAADGRLVGMFSTVRPAFGDQGLEALLDQHQVTINARPIDEPGNPLLSLLLSFGPTLLLIGGFLWLTRSAGRQMGGGVFSLGKSRARRFDGAASERRVTFDDVAGIDEAKAELEEIVDFLKDPEKYTRLGGTAPKGVLVVGAPGTGKTLLARAVAGEAGVPFFSMGASEFVEMIVGVGASRVRDLFKQAREAAPAIIFIDELDAIGRARGGMTALAGHSEQEQTLNQILTEMDGFSSREGVIVLAATNRPDVLDAALLRAGRFDRRVPINPPDKVGRAAILKVHTREMPLADDVDLEEVAASTPGLVGADLRNLANEAALLAARRGQAMVRLADFMDALEKIVLGPARPLVMRPEERERVAYHEGGHTILGLLVPGADPVNRVTIVPRGQALGVTYQRPEDDRHNYTEEYLRARIIGALGGRAAEELVYGTRTTGAENDMQQSTALARHMVTRWGMSERLGPVTLAPRQNPYLPGSVVAEVLPGDARPYSETTAALIDAEVQRILEESDREAVRLLREHRPALDALAAALLEHETLDEAAIHEATGLRQPLAGTDSPTAAAPPPSRRALPERRRTTSRRLRRRGRPARGRQPIGPTPSVARLRASADLQADRLNQAGGARRVSAPAPPNGQVFHAEEPAAWPAEHGHRAEQR